MNLAQKLLEKFTEEEYKIIRPYHEAKMNHTSLSSVYLVNMLDLKHQKKRHLEAIGSRLQIHIDCMTYQEFLLAISFSKAKEKSKIATENYNLVKKYESLYNQYVFMRLDECDKLEKEVEVLKKEASTVRNNRLRDIMLRRGLYFDESRQGDIREIFQRMRNLGYGDVSFCNLHVDDVTTDVFLIQDLPNTMWSVHTRCVGHLGDS